MLLQLLAGSALVTLTVIHLALMATVLLAILAHGPSARFAAARSGRHVAPLSARAPERAGARI